MGPYRKPELVKFCFDLRTATRLPTAVALQTHPVPYQREAAAGFAGVAFVPLQAGLAHLLRKLVLRVRCWLLGLRGGNSADRCVVCCVLCFGGCSCRCSYGDRRNRRCRHSLRLLLNLPGRRTDARGGAVVEG